MDRLSTITEAAAAIRTGKGSCEELVKCCLDRIDRLEPAIRAWVLVDREGALARARVADCEMLIDADRGPLHGMPVGIKDIIDVNGWPTTYGSRFALAERKDRNAEVVTRLGRSGAVLLGKTVTCEWACFEPSITVNPWNPNRSPGGSSSGSAAAVAAGMCMAALGTQTGGSIIRPASFCGVVGLKPSFGLCSRDGVFPLSTSLDHVGVIARSVEDALAVWRVIRDPGHQEVEPSVVPKSNYRLGVVDTATGFVRQTASPDVFASFQAGSGLLASAGATLEPAVLRFSFQDAVADHRTIMADEAASSSVLNILGSAHKLAPRTQELVDEGLRVTQGELLRAFAGKAETTRNAEAMCQRFDALLMPSVSTTAPTMDSTGDSRFQAIWSLAGLPAITIPCGLASDGLPVGMQLIGKRNGERELCEVAAWCERVIGFKERPPLR